MYIKRINRLAFFVPILFLPQFYAGASILSFRHLIVSPADTTKSCECNVDAEIAALKKLKANHSKLPQTRFSGAKNGEIPKYLDPKVPIEERISDLLPRLTLEEKVIELSDSWGSKGIPRLKIPAMLKTEGLHSQSYSTGATVFPQPIMMASTFDQDLVNQIGKATAVESKAANLRVSWSPVLDVARDARWGRVEETYGEDPYLVSRMGVAWINGFQGQGMIAVPKHFAGHGEPLGGRDSHDVGLSDRVMRNIHLVPFRAAVKEAHTGGVMAAYSTWDGVPDNASTELLQKILREEWNFDGIVVSDCSGPENFLTKQTVVNNLEEASRKAILAGVDIECGSAYRKALANAVSKGYLQESDLDANLRRVFRAKLRLGLFEHPGSQEMVWDKLSAYDTPEHRALARKAAAEGSVLLKNDGGLLPLKKDIGVIAVIGPNADFAQIGDYSPKTMPEQLVTVLQGIKNHVAATTRIYYSRGCDILSPDTSGFAEAVQAARKADAVVLVVGDQSTRENIKSTAKPTSGENVDGATLEIPGVQRQLIKAIQATGKPVVLVLVNGKPYTLSWEATHMAAILETWYPGEEGGNATADLLFGDQNPSGRLPITFPRHVGQLPLTYDYLPSGRNYNYYDMPFSPLYRFGFGLSYTTFKYTNLKIEPMTDDPGHVTISTDIENTGAREGDEVAQLYVTEMVTPVITPVIQLQGVRRVHLNAGEKKRIAFSLTPYQLSLLDQDMNRVLVPGRFRVHIGNASPETPAGNENHKSKIGFTDSSMGISGEFEVQKAYQANFNYTLKLPEEVRGGEQFPVTVTVTNNGNLTDVANIQLYGESELDTHRFEIDPGATMSYTFNATLYNSGSGTITAVIGKKILTKRVNVLKAPANLTLSRARMIVGEDGVFHYIAIAANKGSTPYTGNINMLVNGKLTLSRPVKLLPGEKQDVDIHYDFTESGTFLVKIGDTAEKQIVVPGSVGLALSTPLVYLDFQKKPDAPPLNLVTGKALSISGDIARSAPANDNPGFITFGTGAYVNTGTIDLYRKPFTLAATVQLTQSSAKKATIFAGEAPMGADVDNTGTKLSAGVSDDHLFLSFLGRDIKGNAAIPVDKWVHLAYTYDPVTETGSLYINGKLDKQAAQKPYAGPLEKIGGISLAPQSRLLVTNLFVSGSCLGANAIAVLAGKGIESLASGELVTDWQELRFVPNEIKTVATAPAGTEITLEVEAGDANGQVIWQKNFKVGDGESKFNLTVPSNVGKFRLKVRLGRSNFDKFPVIQTAIISGEGKSIRWSTVKEWTKSTSSGSLKIGQ